MSFEHLKPNDFIYVSGYLGSYTKAHDYEDGKFRTSYKVQKLSTLF